MITCDNVSKQRTDSEAGEDVSDNSGDVYDEFKHSYHRSGRMSLKILKNNKKAKSIQLNLVKL